MVINDLINDQLDKKGATTPGEIMGKMIGGGILGKEAHLQTEDLINKKSLNPFEYHRLSKKMNEIQNELIEGMTHFDDNLKLRL